MEKARVKQQSIRLFRCTTFLCTIYLCTARVFSNPFYDDKVDETESCFRPVAYIKSIQNFTLLNRTAVYVCR